MSLTLVLAPVAPALGLTQARVHLKVPDSQHDEDALIADILIPAVTERCELATRRQLITAIWGLRLDAPTDMQGVGLWNWRSDFHSGYFLDIPKPPLQSIVSVTYVDTAGVTQTWASSNYIVDAPAGPRCARGRVAPGFNIVWPLAQSRINAMTVQFTAGYGDDSASVPAMLKAGMLMDLGTLYVNREAVMAGGGAAVELPSGTAAIYKAHRSYAQQRR